MQYTLHHDCQASLRSAIIYPSVHMTRRFVTQGCPPTPQSDHIINTHTQNKLKPYVWICPGTISIPVYWSKHTFDLKNSNFACAGFHKKFDTPPLKPMSLVSESSTHPLQNCECFFSAHLQARELCPQTYSLSTLQYIR